MLQPNHDEKTRYDALNFFFDEFVPKVSVMAMFIRKEERAEAEKTPETNQCNDNVHQEGDIGYADPAATLRACVHTHDISHGCTPESGWFWILPQCPPAFLISLQSNWLRFTTRIAGRITDYLTPLTGKAGKVAFIIDDTPAPPRRSCKIFSYMLL
ncbi:MAG: hypothetical protein K6E38_02610 [Fretibacterium sp.]|nr:hypothetical protein [Fretibacterium sp.]